MAAKNRDYLVSRFGGLCAYCRQEPPTTIDHVVPRALDGPSWQGNLVPACDECNRSKGARTVAEWVERLARERTLELLAGLADSVRPQRRRWRRRTARNALRSVPERRGSLSHYWPVRRRPAA